MPSLDFIYDITEKLDEEELGEDKVDVFFSVKKESEGVFNSSLDRIKEIIAERDDDCKPCKPKAKRKRKKK